MYVRVYTVVPCQALAPIDLRGHQLVVLEVGGDCLTLVLLGL